MAASTSTSTPLSTQPDVNSPILDGADPQNGALVSREAVRLFQWICFLTLEVVDLFGTTTNIINIIIFAKQGFKDPVNVSLMGLAISDLGCLVTLLWSNICFIPAFQEADLPFDSIDVQYLYTSWPHVVFTRVTSCITAMITLQRCLCVAMPLKVKSLITPKRIAIIIAVIFIVLMGSVSPVYYANRYAMKFSPLRNKTVYGLVFTKDREEVEKISFAINHVFVPFTAFAVIFICMIILVFKLRKQANWRRKCAAATAADNTHEREQRITRMVVVISILFIVCFIPSGINFIAMSVEPQLAIGGRYVNTLIVIHGLGFLLESANSSMNIFIYYHMSSRYRTLFRQLFSRSQSK